jgi:hypothetical protein
MLYETSMGWTLGSGVFNSGASSHFGLIDTFFGHHTKHGYKRHPK